MRFVLDTNQLILSSDILEELEDVLSRPHVFNKYNLSIEDIQDYLADLDSCAVIVDELELEEAEVVKDDPSDDIVLATAIAGQADYIVSGDKHLLDLGEYKGIKIITAAEFAEVLQH